MTALSSPAFKAACITIAIAIAALITGIALLNGIDMATIMRDPAASYDFPAYAGALSYLSIGLLTASAAAIGFAASFGGPDRRLLLGAAALTAFLALDDLFMIHEGFAPDILGIPERLFYVGYAVALIAILVPLRRRARDLGALKVAIWFLGVSVLADFFKVHGPFAYWLEDFTKLGGFAAWAVFWVQMARDNVVTAILSRQRD